MIAVSHVDPELATAVERLDGGLPKPAWIGEVGTAPTAVDHRDLVGRRDGLGQEGACGSFDNSVGQHPEAADSRHELESPTPGTIVSRLLVSDDLADHHRQLFGRIGCKPSNRHLGCTVTVQVGTPVIGTHVRFRAELHGDFRPDPLDGHATGANGRVLVHADFHITHQKNRSQVVFAGCLADGCPNIVDGSLIGDEGNATALRLAVRHPWRHCRPIDFGAHHDRIRPRLYG